VQQGNSDYVLAGRSVNPFPLNGVTHDEDVFTVKVDLP
jgi:hypothetical protein